MKMGVSRIILCLSVLGVQIFDIQCQRVINGNLVASVLQDILSPANTQSAMQLIQMAAAGRRAVPEISMSGTIMAKPIEAMPMRAMPCECPRAYVAREIEQPRIISKLEVLPVRNDRMPARLPMVNAVPEVGPTQYRPVEPCPMMGQNLANYGRMPVEPYPMMGQGLANYGRMPVEPYPMMGQGLANYARLPAEVLPAMNPSIVSPYLPIASPVSAFAPPASNMLPPPTQARNQYLRKVPIPPPTL